jgi:hypothetical protein
MAGPQRRALIEASSRHIQSAGVTRVKSKLRECILAAVAEMLRRRPVQEPTRGTRDKLTSLGQHCARQSLKPDHFKRLATNMDSVVNELSGAKQAQMSRQRVSELFN